ncbi:hypothetical protein [Streptosporangium carneum]|uniref:Uncharacterized protein n=1 Tax=Streptosporangium carneum TaxID=47481 RepID=A0A9W6I3U1_9ACTN|nr:hypothetical protein [Streptosporangium carneum]GLK10739.1 hypothetical protein GCM10017600_41450 [Streptosporangium carneum]
MQYEQAPLWRVGLRGFAQGAIGGFLASLLALWFYNNDLWPLDTVFNWQSVIGYTVLLGWISGFGAALTERRRRKTAVKGVGKAMSSSTEHAVTSETSQAPQN